VKIGVLGPSNLLARILSVAKGIEDVSFIPLEYVLHQEAPQLVSENQSDLDAIYFCGSIPYCLCLESVPRSIPWGYLPLGTSGILVAMLNAREHFSDNVRMSVDTLNEIEIRQGLEDCSLYIDAIYTYSYDFLHISVDDIVAFHTKMFSEGKTDICLTCIEAVHKILLEKKLPVYRISPGRNTIRNSIERLILEVHGQTNGMLLSVVGIFRPEKNFLSTRKYEEAMFKLNANLMEHAKKRGILAIPRNSSSFQTIETMGQFLMGTSNLTDISFLSKISVSCGFTVVAGFGVGPSLKIAEEYAAEALDMTCSRRKICYLFDGKRGRPLGESPEAEVFFSHFDKEADLLAKKLKVTLPTLIKYIQGLMCFEGAFTASEFANIVGIQPKSSRKVMNNLQKAMLVQECGLLSHAGRGRPKRLYRATEKVSAIRPRNPMQEKGGDIEEQSRI